MGSSKLTKRYLIFAIFLLTVIHLSWSQASKPAFDLVITNGHIIDGTGSPWYSGDVGIRGGRIAAIGELTGAPRARTIDVRARSSLRALSTCWASRRLTILVDPRLPSKIYQGITTEITGEGGSAAPLNDTIIKATAPATITITSLPTGAAFGNISPVSKSRAWASTSRATWARPRSGAWCWATTTGSRPRATGTDAELVGRPCAKAPSAFRLHSSTRPRPTPKPKN